MYMWAKEKSVKEPRHQREWNHPLLKGGRRGGQESREFFIKKEFQMSNED